MYEFTIEFTGKQNDAMQIAITNITGKTVLLQTIAANDGYNAIQVDAQNLPSGLYIVNIISDSGIIYQSELVIEK